MLAANLLGGIDATDSGHVDIDDEDVRRELVRKFDGFFTGCSLGDNLDITGRFQDLPETISDKLVIVNEKHAYHATGSISR
jgi:hypothetical protein